MLMFKNIVSIAKSHCFHSLGTCRQPMTNETLGSFNLYADSLISFLITTSPDKVLSFDSEIDAISQLAFASLQLPYYCHKETFSSRILLEV